jgi:hypothetical protein
VRQKVDYTPLLLDSLWQTHLSNCKAMKYSVEDTSTALQIYISRPAELQMKDCPLLCQVITASSPTNINKLHRTEQEAPDA